MKLFNAVGSALLLAGGASAAPITFTSTAGDVDFAADRDAFDVGSNMDYYVFKEGSGETGVGTNSLGVIDWTYSLPNEIVTAYSGSMTLRAWDIDPSDQVEVYFDFGGGTRIYAGLVQGSNGGNVGTWEAAVANGTTASLSGWSTTTFNLNAAALAALSGTSGFVLELNVLEEATQWAAVVDYAALTLTYEPGAPNLPSVPEPTTLSMALMGLGGLAVFARSRKRKK